jgi:hypothetical protein
MTLAAVNAESNVHAKREPPIGGWEVPCRGGGNEWGWHKPLAACHCAVVPVAQPTHGRRRLYGDRGSSVGKCGVLAG